MNYFQPNREITLLGCQEGQLLIEDTRQVLDTRHRLKAIQSLFDLY